MRKAEASGISAAATARRHGIVTSVLLRWREELGLGRKEKVILAAVRTPSASTKDALILRGLLPMPDGMAAFVLPDGCCGFAPAGINPEAARRHVADRETTAC